MKTKYITIKTYINDEKGEPDNTYVQIIENDVDNPEDYMVTKYDGKRVTMTKTNRIRFLDGLTGENLNSQKYYEKVVAGCDSRLIYLQLRSPLFKQMLKSLRGVFANPNTQIVTIVAIAGVAAVFFYLYLG